MRLDVFARRRVRAQAKKVLDIAALQEVSNVDELLPVVAKVSGLQHVACEDADLVSGVVATTYRNDDVATIRVSRTCMTRFHTMAHEIGHLVLRHSYCAVGCLEQDMSGCPAGFENFHLAFAPPASAAGNNEKQAEAEAEFFAREMARLWRHVGNSAAAREWAFGLG